MIRYALTCEAGHGFDSWFRSSDDYERQRKRKLVVCPACGSTSVDKQIMRPAVSRAGDKPSRAGEPGRQDAESVAVMSPQERELRAKLRELREHVIKNADYVGEKFPDLARQMHHEEIERRSIYGEAKPDDVQSLIEEGVEVHPLPVLPEDRN